MKKSHLALMMIGIGMVTSSLSYAVCTPVGNQSKATCKAPADHKEEACIERAKQGLDNTDQGADGYQQRQHYLSQIHGGCSEQHARDICTRDCPNP